MTSYKKIAVFLVATNAFITCSDQITVTNNTEQTYWVGIFYTTDDHTKIVPNADQKLPRVFQMPRDSYKKIDTLPRRLGFDRDLIAFKKDPAILYSSANPKFGQINPTMRFLSFKSPSQGMFLNVGTFQFVKAAHITQHDILKVD